MAHNMSPDFPRSSVKGVWYDQRTKRWSVHMMSGGAYRYFGSSPDKATAEDMAERARRGDLKPIIADPRRASSRSKSGVRGVSWNRQFQKWHVRVKIDGKYGSFGLYADLDEAAEVAERARRGEIQPNTVSFRETR
ncbi:hypothetical protein PBI_PIPEFISH_67 [Mycobacterium phage Pipefish]|uniref:AP2/ERF domain-containing protein n=1 Tax=Mycobacterium phage Pipefish TaxID=373413 RepID=Q19YT8_9CAUD|nr:gp67 [Mycobacterium phage Pipefish]ABD58564.1 hypothetical protein PBI_PIPEFISH_67 [Mycobacterium phage Pipefish]